MYVILFAVFIDLVGFGLIIPILPFITLDYGGGAFAGTGLMSIYALMAFLSGPFWGWLSDRIGRRPALTLTFLGGTISYFMLAHADSLAMLFLARGLSGAMAGNVGIVMAAMADLTDNENRGRAMGLIGGAFGLGFAVGPGLGGILAGVEGPSKIYYPGLLAATLAFSAMLLTWFQMRETYTDRGDGDKAAKEPVSAIFTGPARLMLFGMFAVTAIGQSISYSILPFWANAALGWDVVQVGLLMMTVGVLVFFIQTFLVGPLFRTVGEVAVVRYGALFHILGCVILVTVTPTPLVAYIAVPLVMTGLTVGFPALNSVLSQRAGRHQQGTALGFSNGLSALGRVVGPLYGGYVFLETQPEEPYLAVAAVGIITFLWTFVDGPIRRATGRAEATDTASDTEQREEKSD